MKRNEVKEYIFHVAINGNDAWSGQLPEPNVNKTDGPLATLSGARDAARQCGPDKPKRIIVRAGSYFFSEPLFLGADDSHLTIEALSGEDVILSGGRRITGWQKDGERFWSAAVPGVKEGKWDFRQLFVNGEQRRIARLPKKGFMQYESTSRQTGGPNEGFRNPDLNECSTLIYPQGQLGDSFSLKNAEITIYHSWDVSQTRAAAHDATRRTLKLSPPCRYPVGSFGIQDYIVENIREGMFERGQWYLDRETGRVVYWPIEGEEINNVVIEAAVARSLVQIQGTVKVPVCAVRLRNMTLECTVTRESEWGGWGAGTFDGAISLEHVTNCSLSDLTIRNVGGAGVKIRHVSDTAVNNCRIHHAGSCGILFQHGERNLISNNLVHDVGLVFPHAIGIALSNLKHSRIAHNEVHDVPYSGISLGNGPMDMEPAENILEYNRVSEVMTGLNDGGCIYVGGRSRGTLIRGNVLSKAYGRTEGFCNGLYLDEICQDIICEDNVVHGIAGRPLLLHITKGSIIRNNIFVCDAGNVISLTSSEQAILEKNIFYAPGKGIIFRNAPGNYFRNNMYYAGKSLCYESKLLGMRPFIGSEAFHLRVYDVIVIGDEKSDFEDIIRKAPCYPEEIARKLSDEAPLAPRMLGYVPCVTVAGAYPDEAAWEKALILPELRDDRGYKIEMLGSDTRLLYDAKYLYIRGVFHNPLLPPEPDFEELAYVMLGPHNENNIRTYLEIKRCGETKALITGGKPIAIDLQAQAFSRKDGWSFLMKIARDEISLACGGSSPLWRIFIMRSDSFISGLAKRIEAGWETGPHLDDPRFVDPKNHDYRLRADSPALSLGFKAFDPCQAGRN